MKHVCYGYVQHIDGVPFLVHCHKEEKYVCKVMSTHGLLVETDKVTYWRIGNEWKSFKYTEAIANHNTSKHWVDDVNQRRHAPIESIIRGCLGHSMVASQIICHLFSG